MYALRILAATATTLALCSLLYAANAEQSMPKLPEIGAPTTGTAPDVGDISGAGKAIGGVSPEQLTKNLRAARSSKLPLLRGQTEQKIYANFARSVVLVVTKDSLGSGAVIGNDGTIITNWHVVGGNKAVGVIYKPAADGARVYESDAVKANVVRVDQIADLAIIKVATLPKNISPLSLADPSRLKVGADVHAIGHPMGEIWSYTKGVVSQIRPGYEWTTAETSIKHRADVVQTQTPISPGNSGGPLLDDTGALVGIAAFGGGGQALNFAIGGSEIKRFLAATGDRLAAQPKAVAAPIGPTNKQQCDKPRTLNVARTKDVEATVYVMDTDCNGKADSLLFVYDNKRTIAMAIDANENGIVETIYVDKDGDLKFDVVTFDIDEDGKADLIGYDIDDNLEPGRVELAKG